MKKLTFYSFAAILGFLTMSESGCSGNGDDRPTTEVPCQDVPTSFLNKIEAEEFINKFEYITGYHEAGPYVTNSLRYATEDACLEYEGYCSKKIYLQYYSCDGLSGMIDVHLNDVSYTNSHTHVGNLIILDIKKQVWEDFLQVIEVSSPKIVKEFYEKELLGKHTVLR